MAVAVFLDCDGVLNQPLVVEGKPFAPVRVEDFHFYPEAEEACRLLMACISALETKPLAKPHACLPMPMKQKLSRAFGFTSADKMRPGRMSGAMPAASVDLRKERRENCGEGMRGS